MEHTDFSAAIAALEKLAVKEVARAVEAHGGRYVFDREEAPVVAGVLKYGEGTEDIVLTRIESSDGGVRMYGVPAHCSAEEMPVEFLEPAYYGYVLDGIEPAKGVGDVRDGAECAAGAAEIREVLDAS